jgi:hypothetical protein
MPVMIHLGGEEPGVLPASSGSPRDVDSRTGRLSLAGALAVALVLVLVFPIGGSGRHWGAGIAAGAARPSLFDRASLMLQDQAHALLTGDEKAWTDAVAPALRPRYRQMFRSLRGLGVTQFAYRPEPLSDPSDTVLSVDANIAYCFSTCSLNGSLDPPDAHQRLTIERSGGRQIITDMVPLSQEDSLEHAPWEDGPLVIRRGARVTVAGPVSEAKNLDRVLSIAERSATLNDRFAGYLGTPQTRYRVYLADDRAWNTWYGGLAGENAIGYAMPLNGYGVDVVLRMSQIGDDRDWLPITVRHEMGHVITLDGADPFRSDQWLAEGIAEWIGSWPNPARSGARMSSVRVVLFGPQPPATIALPSLDEDAPSILVDAFYGLGQLAVDCMARTYGQPAMFDFVKGVLQEGNTLDVASVRAFNKPFPVVDQGCVRWIKEQVG